MRKFSIMLLILLVISVGFNIYFLVINQEKQSYLEGKYEGGRTYYNYSDDKEYVPKDYWDLGYGKTSNTLIFYKNGTMTYNNFAGTYSYSPKIKIITFSFRRNNQEETYTFEVSDDLKILKSTNKDDNTGLINGEKLPYFIEEYLLKQKE